MSRRLLIPRLLLSAIISSGCSPDRDSQLQPLRPKASPGPLSPTSPPPPTDDSVDVDPAPQLFALHRHVWIRSRPSTQAPWLGFLGLGGAVALKDSEPIPGPGCSAFYPIEPRGFVCLDQRATLDPTSPALEAIRAIAPRRGEPWLHDYAESRQAPRYERLPSPEQQRQREFQLERHLADIAALRKGDFEGDIPRLLQDVDVALSAKPVPDFLPRLPTVHEHVSTLKAGSTLSYSHAFDHEGRTFLVTGDGVLIPKDRVSPYARSHFQGVVLDPSTPLPVAFVREEPRPQYLRSSDGTIVHRGADWPRLASLRLTGQKAVQNHVEYFETRDGLWVDSRDVTEVRASPVTPWGERLEGPGVADGVRWVHRGAVPPPAARRTWIEVSVHEGWMVAYEGTRPVLATLVATGRGEPVEPGSKSLQTSTPPGFFAIQGKYWTSTMAVNSTAHFDVPFAMPYFGAYAIHAAYWHDRWGEKVSLGCVNLSPMDARWVFLWAEPSIPDGWHGMRMTSETGPATVIVVHA